MNTLLNYPGAKWGMAEEIVSLMPTAPASGWQSITSTFGIGTMA